MEKRSQVFGAFLIYLFGSYCWLAVGWYLSARLDEGKLWVFLLGVAILGLPFFLSRLYISTVDKTFLVHQYNMYSWLRAIRGSRFLSTPFWLMASLLSGACMLFWFHTLSELEWLIVGFFVPLYGLLHAWVHRLVLGQYREYRALARGLVWSQRLFAIVGSFCWVLIMLYLLPQGESPLLSEVLENKHKILLSTDQSILVQILDRYSAYYRAVADMGMDLLHSDAPRVFMVAVGFFMFAAIVSFTVAVSAFMVPAREYRRIVSPLSEESEVPIVGFEKSSVLGGMVVIGMLFLYPVLGWQLDLLISEKVRIGQLNQFELAAKPKIEVLEGRFYRSGTHEKLEKLTAEFLAKQHIDKKLIERQMNAAYRSMENNVDTYLDSYYSLPAEYMRLGAMLSNSLEQRLSSDLANALAKGEPFKRFEETLARVILRNEALEANYQQRTQKLLAENEVAKPEGNYWQVKEHSLKDVFVPAAEIQFINGQIRGAAAGVGAVSAIVAAKVASKAVAKGTLKMAATAVTKGAVSKAGAGSASAAAGAAIGSIFPGVGTVAGAVIGAVAGLVVGVTVDYTLLEVEEVLARDEFKLQILQAIADAKAEHTRLLGLD